MVYDTDRREVVLFGGWSTFALKDVWAWNGCQWSNQLTQAQSPIPPLAGTHLGYDTVRHQLMIFGGHNGNPWDLPTRMWFRDSNLNWTSFIVTEMPGRYSGACAFDSARGVWVLQGGRIGLNQSTDETWEWNGSTWTLKAVGNPGPRSGHQMIYDSWRGRCVLYGKANENSLHARETWEWDGVVWTLADSNGPPVWEGLAMAFDSKRGVTVLFGGVRLSDGRMSDDTWEWNGAVWTLVSDSGIDPRGHGAMVFEPDRTQAVFMFGGQDNLPGSQPIPGLWYRRGACPADLNRDGGVDFFDYLDFVAAFSEGRSLADFNEDCEIDFFDYLEFVAAFSRPC
jgi:hypothetical protein